MSRIPTPPALNVIAAAAAAIGALAGCAPLQQAALMYASKSAVGLDVAVGTTESPGSSITIGFKMVDAAYVPVAVSKERANASQERDLASELVRIEAHFGEGSAAGQLDQLSEEDKERLKAYIDAKLAHERAQAALVRTESALKKNKVDVERFKARQEQLKAEQAKHTAATSAETKKSVDEELADLAKRIGTESDAVNKGEALRAAQLERAREAQALASTRLAEAQSAIAGLRTDKRDALSVYGRFNAQGVGAAASSATATLTAGKIFSTGVASQNLTEAVRKEAEAMATAGCLVQLGKLIEGLTADKRAEVLLKFEGQCQPSRANGR